MSVTKIFKVKGMKCGHCSQSVNNALQLARGIKRAVADHEKGTLEVEYLEEVITPEAIQKIVEGLGFELQL